MEKDIELLESFIKEVMPEYEKVKIGCEEYEIPILPIKFKPTKEIAQAIENLINRVKELESKIKALDLAMSNPDYICKDKIKAKIEELEKDIEIHNIYEENWNKIEVLQELLEE